MGHASVSNGLCCPKVHPGHLHEAPTVSTKSVVEDQLLGGISECPWAKKLKDGRYSSMLSDGVSLQTLAGRLKSLCIPT